MLDISKMTIPQLMDAYSVEKNPAQKAAILDRVKALMSETAAQVSGAPKIEFNASGGIYIRDHKARSLAKSGNLYNGSANLDAVMARYLCSDEPESIEVRRLVMALLNSPQSERDKAIAEKAIAKQERNAKAIAAERATIERAVKAGRLPASALTEFDAAQAETVTA